MVPLYWSEETRLEVGQQEQDVNTQDPDPEQEEECILCLLVQKTPCFSVALGASDPLLPSNIPEATG